MVGRSVLGVVGAFTLAAGLAGCGPSHGFATDGPSPTPPRPGFGGGITIDGPLFDGQVTRASRAYPISGGTLLVTRDGTTAVAADPDRGRVFLADLGTRVVRSVATGEEDEVGRAVEGEAGRVYVVARRGGAVLRIDVATATLMQRMPACNSPRGVAYDAAKRQVHVACASGALVTLDPETGAVVRKVALDDDLRDVLVAGDQLIVSRFRSAELLVVDAGGRMVSRSKPASATLGLSGPATVAYRATAAPDGTVVVVHQQSSTRTLGTGLGAYYGGTSGCGGSVTDTFISTARPIPRLGTTSSLNVTTAGLNGAIGPLDVAISGDGKRVAVVSTGNSWVVGGQQPTVGILPGAPGTPPSGCWNHTGTKLTGGEPVAIAFNGQGKYIVQYREPAKLVLETDEVVKEIVLTSESRADTGLALFHLNAGGGVSCASCHPEAGMDGHVWNFSEFGARVTQPLEGQVSSRRPFHWNGDLADWPSLIGEVMMKRMAMPIAPSKEQSEALLGWLDTVPARLPADDLIPDAVERGRALFQDSTVACASCHGGAMYTDNLPHEVGSGGVFVAPSLVGVGSRAPLMHDGCASTLRARFTECGGGDRHGKTSHLSTAQVDDLVAFLRSL
jgi:mono/diheme cytochrome c family protein